MLTPTRCWWLGESWFGRFLSYCSRYFVYHCLYRRVLVYGREHLRPNTLVCAKHTHTQDFAVIGQFIPDRFRIVMRASLLHPWPVGVFFSLVGGIPVPRSRDADTGRGPTVDRTQAHAQVHRALTAGLSVLVYPEGTRQPETCVVTVRPTFPELVPSGDTCITPVGTWGIDDPHARTVVVFGQPVRFADLEGEPHNALGRVLTELTEQARRISRSSTL